jgi:ElaB/YqjD/DUF883 family membrane-anchored ribosome-binding protein
MIDPASRNHTSDAHTAPGAAQAVSDSYDSLRTDISNLSKSVKTYATENFGAAAEQAQHTAQEQLGGLEAAVRKSPVQSALIAAGIGLVVGLLVTR